MSRHKKKKLKNYLKGWGNKNKGEERKLKNDLHEELMILEGLEEEGMLDNDQLHRKTEIQKKNVGVFGTGRNLLE